MRRRERRRWEVGGQDGPKGPSEAVLKITPKNGADGVGTDGALKVTAAKGKLVDVQVKDAKGNEVKGKIAKGGTGWEPASHLATRTKYSVKAHAKDSEGRKAAKSARFTTLTPENTFVGRFTPENGDKVGVGMPVSINFNHGIKNPEAVEKAITVNADPEVDVEGHWFGNDRLDFRPEEYWEAGTKVELDLNLDGVEGYAGVYGTQDKSVNFTIGRSQVSVVDAKSKKMTVTRDGEELKTIAITSGSAEHPTYNGRMVISERHKVTRMDGDTVGFGRARSGRLRHQGRTARPCACPRRARSSTATTGCRSPRSARPTAATAASACFDKKGGGDKGTPGCLVLQGVDGRRRRGVKNSKDKTIQPDNGLNGWNMDWEKWKAPQE